MPPNPLLDEVLNALAFATATGGGIALKPILVRQLFRYIETLQRIAIMAALDGVDMSIPDEQKPTT